MNEQKLIAGPVVGYKMLDKNLCCHGKQYKVGETVWHEGPLKMCESGLHFCTVPSGVWSYYSEGRLFRIEAFDVLKTSPEPGANAKRVCRGIRLVDEIAVDGANNTGNSNTGNSNTGDSNTGHFNTGNRNTGHFNTGDSNTGDSNTGHFNTGHFNTGRYNTGDSNTGHFNTGHFNTGNRNTGRYNTANSNTGHYNTGNSNTGRYNTGRYNTGDSNTGHFNTGNSNTGHGNVCDNSSGHFNTATPPLLMFDSPADFAPDKDDIDSLAHLLSQDEPFDPTPYLTLPNATAEKILALHQLHIAKRKEMK